MNYKLDTQVKTTITRTIFTGEYVNQVSKNPIDCGGYAQPCDERCGRQGHDRQQRRRRSPDLGFDAQNRQSNESFVAVNPVDVSIIGIGADDYRATRSSGACDIPSGVLGWPAEAIIHNMNEHEADTILANMKGRMEG